MRTTNLDKVTVLNAISELKKDIAERVDESDRRITKIREKHGFFPTNEEQIRELGEYKGMSVAFYTAYCKINELFDKIEEL